MTTQDKLFPLLPAHMPLWGRLTQAVQKKQFPQATLFIGSCHAELLPLVRRLMAAMLCHAPQSPCEQCSTCHLLVSGHPDIMHIQPSEKEKAIKIDQIRELQQSVYQTPQRGALRFIVIHPANKMNLAAANALLKILEEPPPHTHFILIAEQTEALPVTILSRCQKYMLLTAPVEDYLQLMQESPATSGRGVLLDQQEKLLDQFYSLVMGQLTVCALAACWAEHSQEDILWFMGLLTAKIIYYKLVLKEDGGDTRMNTLAHYLQVTQLFHQLDQVYLFQQKSRYTTLNPLLTLEALLLGFTNQDYPD